ncbi:unnamed protein product, partial [Prorocentrum cordatum]
GASRAPRAPDDALRGRRRPARRGRRAHAAAVTDLAGGAPFELNGGEASGVAVSRYTDAVGIACYLGPWHELYEGSGSRGRCNLVQGGEVVGDTLVQESDWTLHSAMARLTEETTIWCYADGENSFELKCRKVNRDGTTLSVEASGELSVKGNSVNVLGSSVISATRFSDASAVVCSDNPQVQAANPSTRGPLQCGLLIIKAADDEWCPSCLDANSNSGIKSLDTGSIESLSVISFSESVGAVCYTSGAEVACTMLALSGSDVSDSSLDFGVTLTLSTSGANAAAAALSADAGFVCYTEGESALCRKLSFDGSALSKGEPVEVSQGALSQMALAAFSEETVVACLQSAADSGVQCYALDAETSAPGAALSIDDAAAGQQLALVSLTDTAGLLCYETSSSQGVCRDLSLAPGTATSVTTTPHTTTATETTATTATATTASTETVTASSTSFATTTLSATTATGTSSATGTATSGTGPEVSTAPASTTAAESGATAPTPTGADAATTSARGSATEPAGTSAEASVVDSGAPGAAGLGRAAAGALAAAALWCW